MGHLYRRVEVSCIHQDVAQIHLHQSRQRVDLYGSPGPPDGLRVLALPGEHVGQPVERSGVVRLHL